MTHIFIEKNIAQALEVINSKKMSQFEVYFIKNENSLEQKKIQEQIDLEFLKKHHPKITPIFRTEVQDYISAKNLYFGWDAFEERQCFEPLNVEWGLQNRLFDKPLIKQMRQFTPFRKVAEQHLQGPFKNNIFQPDDQEVFNELEYYFEKTHLVRQYFEIRNGVVGRDYSTKWSRYLSSGRLNVRFLFNYLKNYEHKYGSNKSTYWIQFELLWREFFYWSYQEHKNNYFSVNGLNGPPDFSGGQKKIEKDRLFSKDLFMQAVLNELIETGFISNRLRQVFASALINTYHLDWRQGALFFEDYLADYDVYSNWGNWQYLAGVGHDPRGHRIFDVIGQLKRYDPCFTHIKKWTQTTSEKQILENLEGIYKKL